MASAQEKLPEAGPLLELPEQDDAWKTGLQAWQCPECKASGWAMALPTSCPCCNTRPLADASFTGLGPSVVLPFTYPRIKAERAFRQWLGNPLFRTLAMRRLAAEGKLQGVYVPGIVLDVMTRSSWQAYAAFVYDSLEANGKNPPKEVKKLRWMPASGYFEHMLGNILQGLPAGLPATEWSKVNPFDLARTVPWSPEYLEGWTALAFPGQIEPLRNAIETQIKKALATLIAARVPGETHQALEIQTQMQTLRLRTVWLPVWVAAAKSGSVLYRFIVNGRNGVYWGSERGKWGRITLYAVLAVLAIFLLVWRLYR